MGKAIEYKVLISRGGSKFWYHNDKLHREDGPAIEHADGSRYWYLNGKQHREDGPAVEYVNGSVCWEFWFLNGVEVKKEDHPINQKTIVLDGVKYKLVRTD